MYEFWYDYVKSKFGEKSKLCYVDTGFHCIQKKQMIFIKTLKKMLKQVLTLEIMS